MLHITSKSCKCIKILLICSFIVVISVIGCSVVGGGDIGSGLSASISSLIHSITLLPSSLYCDIPSLFSTGF